jgi:hypothetical protein
MYDFDGQLTCDNCGVEITWTPLVVDNKEYCCLICYQGRHCDCREVVELEDEQREAESWPVSLFG